MKKYIFALAITAVSLSAVGAQAGGFGRHGGNTGVSSGLINVSPSIGLGDIMAGVTSGGCIRSAASAGPATIAAAKVTTEEKARKRARISNPQNRRIAMVTRIGPGDGAS